jgi:MoaA/NifB/PqqE/SkfB family radical SAM enzyme
VPVLYTVEGDESREPGAREPGAREPGAGDPETLEPAAVALRKHALGQTWWAPPGDTPHRSLAPHPRCEACLQRLRCPTAYVPREYVAREEAPDAGEGPGARPAPPRAAAGHARDAEAGPAALAAALERLAPGQTLVVTGRVGRVVLRGDPAAAEAAAGAGASASASESAVELEDARDVAGEQAAADATDVVDPQWVADLARVHGVEVSRYALAGGPPPDGVPDGYWLELRRPEIAAPPGPRPGQALLMVCNVCVTRCLMCGLPDLFDRAYLSPEHVLRWLTELRLLGTLRVDLFGGEVTLRPDLLHLADFARHRGLRTSFITTGYQLDEAWVDELAASDVDQVEVALDGDRAEIHNPIKGGLEAFDDAVALVRRLAEDGGRVVDVNTVILAENLGRLPTIVELVADLGADEQRLFSCVRFPLAPGLQEPLGPAEVRRIWEQDVPEARRRAAARGLAFEVCGAVDPTAADRDAAFAAFAAGAPNPLPRRGWRCGAPRHERSLLIDGTVLPCQNPSFYVDLLERPGNALRQWLWEVLASPRFAELAAGAGLWESCGRCICYRDAGDRDGGGGDEAGR